MSLHSNRLQVVASNRFVAAYRSASLPIKNFAEGAVQDLIQRVRSDPRIVLSHYDRLKQCKGRVIEIDICGAYRILADYHADTIVLLDLGDHDVVPRYNDQKLKFDLSCLRPAPPAFLGDARSKFFRRNPDRTITVAYSQEFSDDWLYFLAEEQRTAQEDVLLGILYRDSPAFMVVGGPGTGKTCILLNLLRDLAEDFDVGIHLSDALAEYIEYATGADVSAFRANPFSDRPLDVLLVDDPSFDEIKAATSAKENGRVGSIVLAFDPLQLEEQLSDEAFNKIRYDGNYTVHRLQQCYRQKANLGKNTKYIVDAIAESTPFMRPDRTLDHRLRFKKMTEFSNDMSFPNPAGYLEVYPEATGSDVTRELLRLGSSFLDKRGGLLIVFDDERLPEDQPEIKRFIDEPNVKVVPLSQVTSIKGLEFQHAFIFLTRGLFDEIENGFGGSGPSLYNRRRLLRIPFSRAKDSCVTFAL